MNSTHGSFAAILKLASPELRPVCRLLRSQILSLHKGAYEIVWPAQKIASFGVGPKKMSDHYAYIGVQASHVNLGFYHGASLRDPSGLLEGTGRKLRHVKIRDLGSAKRPAITLLLRQAIAERRKATA